MLRHDIVNHPTEQQLVALNQKKTRVIANNVINNNKRILTADPLHIITEEEMDSARQLLKDEIALVKDAMGHGDLAIENYTKVWDECYGQVITYVISFKLTCVFCFLT